MDCARGVKGELDLKPRAQACTRPQAPNVLPGGRRSPRSLFPVSGLMFVGFCKYVIYWRFRFGEEEHTITMGFARFEFVFVRLT